MDLPPTTPIPPQNTSLKTLSPRIVLLLVTLGIVLIVGGYFLLRTPKEIIEAIPVAEESAQNTIRVRELSEEEKVRITEEITTPKPKDLSEERKQKILEGLQR